MPRRHPQWCSEVQKFIRTLSTPRGKGEFISTVGEGEQASDLLNQENDRGISMWLWKLVQRDSVCLWFVFINMMDSAQDGQNNLFYALLWGQPVERPHSPLPCAQGIQSAQVWKQFSNHLSTGIRSEQTGVVAHACHPNSREDWHKFETQSGL